MKEGNYGTTDTTRHDTTRHVERGGSDWIGYSHQLKTARAEVSFFKETTRLEASWKRINLQVLLAMR
jgi:hypothetical protein